MLTLEVIGIRGIDQLELKLQPGHVTKWRGENAVGKTSASAALAALLARHTDPMGYGVQKSRNYINRRVDPAGAMATLTCQTAQGDPDWSITWRVGAQVFDEVGDVPAPIPLILATPKILVGEMALKKGLVESMCEAEIGRVELIDRLSKIFSETTDVATATSLADQILSGTTGWAQVDAIAQQNGLEAKRTWRDTVARDKQHSEYKPGQAAAWRPGLWEPSYDAMTAETVDRQVFTLNQELEIADDTVRDLRNRQEEVLAHQEQHRERQQLAEKLNGLRSKVVPGGKVSAAKGQFTELQQELAQAEMEHTANIKKLPGLGPKFDTHKDAVSEIAGIQEDIVQQRIDQEAETRTLDANLQEERKVLARFERTPQAGTCALCGQNTPPNLHKHAMALVAQKNMVKDLEQGLALLPAEWEGRVAENRKRIEQWTPHVLPEKDAASLHDEHAALLAKNENLEDTIQSLRSRRNAAEALVGVYENSAAFAQQATEVEEAMNALDRVIGNMNVQGPTDTEVEQAQRLVDRIREQIRQHEHIKDMLDIHRQAQASHSVVCAWERIRRFVGPEGIRAEKIAAGMKQLEVIMQRIQKVVDLKGVVVKNAKIMVGDLDVEVVAESEQWFASVVVKLAMLIYKKQPVAVIDGADKLDPRRYKQALEVITAIAVKQNMAILLTETER